MLTKNIGVIPTGDGHIFKGSNFNVVKKSMKKGESIAKHDHPSENVVFIVAKGKVEVCLNEVEKHILEPGKLLEFDGTYSISIDFLEDAEFFVTLIKK